MHKRESTKHCVGYFLNFPDTIVPALTESETYINGGFNTIGAIVKALKTVDSDGHAHPVHQEPKLCIDILACKIKSAIRKRLDEIKFGLYNVTAGSQIRVIGRDEEPTNLSQGNEMAFQKNMRNWSEQIAHVDMHGIQPILHGIVY